MNKVRYVAAATAAILCCVMPSPLLCAGAGDINKRGFSDQSVRGYLAERTCWWNEVCKEEFQTQFRCRCPTWSFCRSPGRYYNAFCSMTGTGYIWAQPPSDWTGP